MDKESGYTIVEVLTCLAIMTILAGIITPNFIGWLPTHRLGIAARDTLSFLRQARMIAAKENANVTVQFDIANDSYHAFLDDGAGSGGIGAGDGVQNGTERTCKAGAMPAGIDLNSSGLPNDRISFNSRGLPEPVMSSIIHIRNSNNAVRQIMVNQTGHTKIVIP